MNVIIIKGRLVRDPELRRTQSGKAVCSISVAVNRPFAKDEVDYIDCVFWEQRAEFVSKYFVKGREILVRGSLQSRPYEDKNGNKRTAWEIKADDAEFCGSKNEGGGDVPASKPKKTTKEPEQSADGENEEDDELPF